MYRYVPDADVPFLIAWMSHRITVFCRWTLKKNLNPATHQLMAPLSVWKSTDGHPVRKSLTFQVSDSKHFLLWHSGLWMERKNTHYFSPVFVQPAIPKKIQRQKDGEKEGVRKKGVSRKTMTAQGHPCPSALSEPIRHQTGRKRDRSVAGGRST